MNPLAPTIAIDLVEAVEACADDTKGQKCYICLEAVHPRTGEGLVSGFCACRGGSSFAHISCVKRKAQLAMEEALENNLDGDRLQSRWEKWYSCELCGQEYHGVVYSAMGWAWAGRAGEAILAIPNCANGLAREIQQTFPVEAPPSQDQRRQTRGAHAQI